MPYFPFTNFSAETPLQDHRKLFIHNDIEGFRLLIGDVGIQKKGYMKKSFPPVPRF